VNVDSRHWTISRQPQRTPWLLPYLFLPSGDTWQPTALHAGRSLNLPKLDLAQRRCWKVKLEACRRPNFKIGKTRLKKFIFTAHCVSLVHRIKRYLDSPPPPTSIPPNPIHNVQTPIPDPSQGPIVLPLYLHLRPANPNPPRLPPKASPPSLPIHTTRYIVRWIDLHATHDEPAADFPHHEGYAQPPAVAALHDLATKHRGR
jgi:hypothetical protein